MIFDFTKELAQLDAEPNIIKKAMILALIADHAAFVEQRRIVEILQRKAINPQDLIAEIRKPRR